MAGFDRALAASTFGAPQDFQAQAVYAVGRLGDPSTLPEALRLREKPSQRRSLAATAFEDVFGRDGESAV
jgi:HEAT repeat protein